MQPSARSLILDLLATLRRGTMPVGALVDAGALFRLEGNAVRVALTRLLATGHVVRDQRGRYRLGPSAGPVERRVRSWRDLDRATRPWAEGSWIAVHHAAAAGTPRRAAGSGRERALRLLGFRTLRPGLSLRPDNLRMPLEDLRRELSALGLPEADLVCTLAGLDPASEARARGLWEVESLNAAYRRRRLEIERSEKRLARAGTDDAMVESFLLGGAAIREVVLDPLLPEAIFPTDDRRALVAALTSYDRIGRSAWAGFLRRFDVPHIRTPLDGPLGLTAARLAG